MGDLGHRALVVRRIALADPKRMGDQNRCVPADLRKNGTRDDHRDPKRAAMKKNAMKVDDLSRYAPDDPKMDATKAGDPSHYVPDDPKKNGTRDDHRDPKMDAKKTGDQSHYVPDDPKMDAKKTDAKKVDDQNHCVPDDPMMNE